MSTQTIPIVDLQKYISGTESEKQSFVEELGKAFEQVGFVSVKNHGVPEFLIDEYYTLVQKFFELPTDVKKGYEIPELAGQRGYTSFGKETAKGYDAPDLKEFWQLGQTVEGEDVVREIYPPNVVVQEVPVFTQRGVDLYKAFENSGRYLLRAIANHLDLPENYFDAHIHNGNSILRAIHYPPIKQEPKSAIRAEQHEDINLITLLVGASAEGLQLLNKQDEWLDITAPEGCIVVNVGDMLQRLTNNRLKSTTHRVVNPPKEKWHTPRYSIPFFLHPRSEMRLDCLNSCVSSSAPLAYEPISAGEYLDERLREIGLKK
ncbi:MAG: isopenicillin N synthase family oxygenase [Chitinophagales bacterium]|nr:isopenicillin N synthase family oxygenase [Chitinophagales bacterium]MCO5280724.1 isopenicillin N synthase family oxygenase [Chitinophagales bacterium]OJV29851.1 MAG: flavonol synthase [Bacteroidetes bacterium 37-13]HRN94334.1 2-oxoglutarate and iron-dependent oxygenase domain-containing protein [Chitinophagales bacterium]HRP38999.1 2-oxoglutarate and iron-dependent oxygenase domain-containing protein [Chitinophagales bacterium]